MRFVLAVVAMVYLWPVSGLRAADPVPMSAARKPETFLMLPEPRAMRSSTSQPYGGARLTVFTPAHERMEGQGILPYTPQEFAKLGIGWDTFMERARKAADHRLASLQPDLIKNSAGQVVYGVYRGSDPTLACLLIAPSLATVFQNVLGDDLWIVAPDRHSVFIFPAKAEILAQFAEDLKQRFDEDALAASEEIFELKKGGEMHVVGNFTKRRSD